MTDTKANKFDRASREPIHRVEQIRAWCADPESQDEIGYDYARELLVEVDRLREIIRQNCHQDIVGASLYYEQPK